jgi:hypothetical protein
MKSRFPHAPLSSGNTRAIKSVHALATPAGGKPPGPVRQSSTICGDWGCPGHSRQPFSPTLLFPGIRSGPVVIHLGQGPGSLSVHLSQRTLKVL